MPPEQLEIAAATYTRRLNTFVKNGLPMGEAENLADQMFERDREGLDDRRVCFECKNYVANHCTAYKDKFGRPTRPLRFILQRCDHFKLKGSK
jgi:hypothetical protein